MYKISPPVRFKRPYARQELADLGCATTLEYLGRAAQAVLDETGLLPHLNPGVLTREDLEALREVSVSMGIMLETTSVRLSERGQPHYYRIQGPRLLIEYDNFHRDAHHVHAVWRDPDGDFGDDILRAHITQHH